MNSCLNTHTFDISTWGLAKCKNLLGPISMKCWWIGLKYGLILNYGKVFKKWTDLVFPMKCSGAASESNIYPHARAGIGTICLWEAEWKWSWTFVSLHANKWATVNVRREEKQSIGLRGWDLSSKCQFPNIYVFDSWVRTSLEHDFGKIKIVNFLMDLGISGLWESYSNRSWQDSNESGAREE